MPSHFIHWSEGLFIRPHHFQVAERKLREEIQLAEGWNVGYPYGLRKIDLDQDALANWRVSLRICHARLRDGTHVRYPEDASLAPLVIPREAFRNPQDRVMVYLAVPRLQMGRRNADVAAGSDGTVRWLVESQEVEDENQPGNEETLEVRWLNAKLLLGTDDLSGYETLPVVRLRLGSTAEAPPEIDPEYIPPILACDASSILQDQILGNIHDQLGSAADKLARQMIDRGVAFESGHREDLERIHKLIALNTALGYLTNLPFVRGLHPLPVYMDLCRIVGLLAIFQPERRMPEVPRYDHDDLGPCFYAVRKLLAVGPEERRMYVKRPFVGAGQQMQVRLDREWLGTGWAFYIGVESKLPFHEIDRLLMRDLDLKLGSSEEVDMIYRRRRAGIRLTAEPEPPRDFPGTNWTYWKVDRGSDAWDAVEHTLNLGIRFNEKQVVGQIDGEQKVQMKAEDGDLIGLTFALYAIPAQAAR